MHVNKKKSKTKQSKYCVHALKTTEAEENKVKIKLNKNLEIKTATEKNITVLVHDI